MSEENRNYSVPPVPLASIRANWEKNLSCKGNISILEAEWTFTPLGNTNNIQLVETTLEASSTSNGNMVWANAAINTDNLPEGAQFKVICQIRQSDIFYDSHSALLIIAHQTGVVRSC